MKRATELHACKMTVERSLSAGSHPLTYALEITFYFSHAYYNSQKKMNTIDDLRAGETTR